MKRTYLDERGSVLTEYGLLVIIVALGLIVVLGAFRQTLVQKFNEIRNQVSSVHAGGTTR